MVKIHNFYLAYQRDFQSPHQLIQAIQHFAAPNYKASEDPSKVLEHMKTIQYNLWQKLQRIEQMMTPVTTFIKNIETEIKEEEKLEKKGE